WGYGFYGNVAFDDGKIVYESTEPFQYKSSVITLLRFEKGLFQSPSIQERDFSDVLDRAMEGADFGEEEESDPVADGIALFFTALVMFLGMRKVYMVGSGKVSKRTKKRLLGTTEGRITWYRDIPMDGELIAADYALMRLGMDHKNNALAAAEILRMIYKGYLDVRKSADGKVEITFAGKERAGSRQRPWEDGTPGKEAPDSIAQDLWSMMLEASGEDVVLQDTEFSTWSRRHKERLYSWTNKIGLQGVELFKGKGWMSDNKWFTPAGQKETQQLLGFKKYLEDFTLTRERETVEVHLWQEYLVYGTLFGIADKVVKQLKDIDPVLFEQAIGYDYTTINSVLYSMQHLSNAITSANRSYVNSTYSGGSSGGFGGGTSFGGGGGFSGGGHGGGGR
ncbi:MAG: DUF2207 domain-containing protein, partial [Bacteroidales bacterium]|nr:DUF2207 domain-containing protein [Bacteroidales bacterium]